MRRFRSVSELFPFDRAGRFCRDVVDNAIHTFDFVYDISTKPPSTIEWE